MQMKYFDLVKTTNHDFVKYRRVAVVVSLIVNALVLVGVIVWPGLNYGVDFAGGTELQVHFKKPVEPGEIRDLVGHQGFGDLFCIRPLKKIESRARAIFEKIWIEHISVFLGDQVGILSHFITKSSQS